MREKVANIPCPDPECGETAEVRADKRGKLYVICPECGRFTYNTLRGQERLKARLDALAAQEAGEVGGVKFGPPAPEPEPEQPQEPEAAAGDEDQGGPGLGPWLALGGVVIGLGAWWWNRKAA